ncbi:hypothetical protein C8R43DRAFT_1123000 [Mycena crocata]|nr:hypothetical protein C8R43DRAFT_1123000 [Mycena crocata]
MDVDPPDVTSVPSLLQRFSDAEPSSGPSIPRSLLERFSSPTNAVAGPSNSNRSLIDRLRPADEELRGISDAEKALLRRVDVKLSERVSTQTKPLRVRKHNRAKKRVERLIVVDEELHAWERLTNEFPWTDEEIDWFISMENLDFYDFEEFFRDE